MKVKGIVSVILILCALCLAPLEVNAQGIQKKLSELTKSALQTAIEDWAKEANHYGVSASVILKNGTEWVNSTGTEASGKTLTSDHLIWMASITKSMTGAIIMKLAEEKKLGLDDPISRWLPTMDNVDPKITVRQLLNHTNGLANFTRNPELSTTINADLSKVFSAAELIAFVGPKVFAAGERTQYTNTSFVLLGMIAEKVAGKPILELYHKMLWGPLKLSEIFLPGFESPAGPVANAWRNGQQITPLDEMSLLTIGNSAFGLFSNARTISRWGRTLFSDSFLSASMRTEMLSFVDAAGNIPGESGAGLGIRKYDFLGREQWGHSGGSPLGSSLMIHDPTTGITVTVIMNQGRGSGHFRLAPRLLEIASKGK